jgi:hypothetical protein
VKGISMTLIKNSFPIILLASAATCIYGADQLQNARNEIKRAFTTLVALEGHIKSVRETRETTVNVPDADKVEYRKCCSNFVSLLNTDYGHQIATDYAFLNFAEGSLESAVIMHLMFSMGSAMISTGQVPKGYPALMRILNGPASKQN